MTEQERASVISFVIKSAGVNVFYEENVPESFAVPSFYFPNTEIEGDGDTLSSYAEDFAWYVSCFHKSTQEAHALAQKAAEAILKNHRLIPILNKTDGSVTGKYLRVNKVKVKTVDEGAAELQLHFTIRRAFDRPKATKADKITPNIGRRT